MIIGLNAVWCNQEFLKRKQQFLGMSIDAVRRRGTWSEAKRVRDERLVFGKEVSHGMLMKHLSRRTKVGHSCLLDQVKARSTRGFLSTLVR